MATALCGFSGGGYTSLGSSTYWTSNATSSDNVATTYTATTASNCAGGVSNQAANVTSSFPVRPIRQF